MRSTALALCAAGTLAARPATAQLLVDPLEVTILAAGADRVTSSFSLTNTTGAPVQATISRGDWDRVETGDNRFLPAGSTGNSCGQMLSVSPLSVRIEPRASRVVRLAVQPSPGLTRECWDIVFIEEVPQRTTARGNSLQYIFRTGVKVYIAPPGLARDAAIENMEIVDTRAKRQVAIRFRNTGAMHLVAKGRLEIRRLDNSLAREVAIEEFPALPGAIRRVLVDIPADLTPGDYVVLGLIDFGGSELVAGQIDYQAK